MRTVNHRLDFVLMNTTAGRSLRGNGHYREMTGRIDISCFISSLFVCEVLAIGFTTRLPVTN